MQNKTYIINKNVYKNIPVNMFNLAKLPKLRTKKNDSGYDMYGMEIKKSSPVKIVISFVRNALLYR